MHYDRAVRGSVGLARLRNAEHEFFGLCAAYDISLTHHEVSVWGEILRIFEARYREEGAHLQRVFCAFQMERQVSEVSVLVRERPANKGQMSAHRLTAQRTGPVLVGAHPSLCIRNPEIRLTVVVN